VHNLEGPDQFEDSANKSLKQSFFFFFLPKTFEYFVPKCNETGLIFLDSFGHKARKMYQAFFEQQKIKCPFRVNLDNLVSGRKKGCCKYKFIKLIYKRFACHLKGTNTVCSWLVSTFAQIYHILYIIRYKFRTLLLCQCEYVNLLSLTVRVYFIPHFCPVLLNDMNSYGDPIPTHGILNTALCNKYMQ